MCAPQALHQADKVFGGYFPAIMRSFEDLIKSLLEVDKVRTRASRLSLGFSVPVVQSWLTHFSFPPTNQAAADAHASRLVFDLAAITALDSRIAFSLPTVLATWIQEFGLDVLATPAPPTFFSPVIAHAFPTTPVMLLTIEPDANVKRLWEFADDCWGRARIAQWLRPLLRQSLISDQEPPAQDSQLLLTDVLWGAENGPKSIFYTADMLDSPWSSHSTSRSTTPGADDGCDFEDMHPHVYFMTEDIVADDNASSPADDVSDKHWPALGTDPAQARRRHCLNKPRRTSYSSTTSSDCQMGSPAPTPKASSRGGCAA